MNELHALPSIRVDDVDTRFDYTRPRFYRGRPAESNGQLGTPAGTPRLVVRPRGVTSFDPFLGLNLLMAALICLLGPIALGYWWRSRAGTSFVVFGWGAVVFFVSQIVLRLPWQIPLNRWVIASHRSWLTAFVIVSALTAALFEEVGRWVGYRTVLKDERSRNAGVMFGLGHGACESILLVGLPIMGVLIASALANSGMISEPLALQAVRQQAAALGGWGAQLAVIERASSIAAHVGLSLIVLQGFVRGSHRWLSLAILLHTALDAIAGLSTHALHIPALYVELVVGVMSLAVLGAGLRLAAPAVELSPDVAMAAD
jgi:uncharacterized membrane protein YhfC